MKISVRNLLFAAFVLWVVFGPLLVLAIDKSGMDLPSWVTAGDARYLDGDLSQLNVKAKCNVPDFLDGELQNEVEKAVGRCVPFKALAMLESAKLQRSAIFVSGRVFGYDVFPAYYGSAVVEDCAGGRLLGMPARKTSQAVQELEHSRNAIEHFAVYSGIPVYLYLAPDSTILGSPPPVSAPLTYRDAWGI